MRDRRNRMVTLLGCGKQNDLYFGRVSILVDNGLHYNTNRSRHMQFNRHSLKKQGYCSYMLVACNPITTII